MKLLLAKFAESVKTLIWAHIFVNKTRIVSNSLWYPIEFYGGHWVVIYRLYNRWLKPDTIFGKGGSYYTT